MFTLKKKSEIQRVTLRLVTKYSIQSVTGTITRPIVIQGAPGAFREGRRGAAVSKGHLLSETANNKNETTQLSLPLFTLLILLC